MNIRFPSLTFTLPRLSVWRLLPSLIFWILAIGLGAATFLFTRNLLVCWTITNLPGLPPESCGAAAPALLNFNPEGTPIPQPTPDPASIMPEGGTASAPMDVPAPTWDGGSRINFLFIGIDARDWEAKKEAPRSDTMILFTIDPVSKTAGMLSIPRDLWVNIPGSGYGRINMAYAIGEGSKLPGGGPALAMKTVEQLLGVPVHYYGQVDFNTFIEMINAIGGINVMVRERLVLDPIGTGKDKVVITPGYRHLPGWKALAYARTRKTEGGDVDRARRQQDVIFAIMDKVLNPDYFPTFIRQAPQLYQLFSSGIRTNLSLEDGIRLAVLLQSIPRENIKTGIIDYTMITFGRTVLGGEDASVFKAKPDQIRILRDEIFGSGAASAMASGDPLELARQEGARIRIINGTYTPDLGQRAAAYLQGFGLNVAELGSDQASQRTVIVLHSPKLYTLRLFLHLFGLNGNSGTSQIKFEPNPASTVDIELRIGLDVANANLIP